ncbi:thiopeptide-type bacteriocin biosynthesis protein [Chitinophaga sp. OAE865]|uniref:lantibiotic dehydratase n=1 Tax=Chitinophaga sp. OAE865 TaxID=2817898 RepID=UPI001AE175C0
MSRLRICDFFLLRMPLLSYEEVLQLHRNTSNDQDAFVAALRKIYSRPLLQEAVFLASPELYTEMMKWLPAADNSLKLPLALYRYLLRMSTRCTPYGLFAGCSTGYIHTGPTQLPAPAIQQHQPVARLDMAYLSELMGALTRLPEIGNQLHYFPNNSLYRSGGGYRYFEYQLRDKRRHYFLSAFSQNDYTEALLAAARKGTDLPGLIAVLTGMDIPDAEARAFIETLIHNQILVADLSPQITGGDNLGKLIGSLQALSPVPACVPALQRVQQLLQQPAEGISSYLEAIDILASHFPALGAKDPIQVDLFFKPDSVRLAETVINTLMQRLEWLRVFGNPGAGGDLQQFKERFLRQYDQREIPLMMALDSESGIGYGVATGEYASYTPLIDDLVMPAGKKDSMVNWNAQTKFVLKHFLASRASQAAVISLTDADLDELAAGTDQPELPPFLCLMGSLIAATAADMDNGNFSFLLKACHGPNALALMGRFAAGNPGLENLLRDLTRKEQLLEKDRLLAEIVHLPEGRIGNVLLRPSLYDYEIPFLGKSSLPEDFQLPVSDLLVSVRNNRVILRSQRWQKEVVPRLTSAHNFTRGLSVYKFLCDLQQQDAFSVQWNWGILQEEPFLPRVVYHEVILERARWYLTREAFESLLASHPADDALLLLKEQRQLPRHVQLAEGDNDLLIDFTSAFGRMLLTDKLKKGNVILYECLFNETTRLSVNEQGAFCNEIIIPLCNTVWQPPAGLTAVPSATGLQRSFAPGSEWMYIKIYCGPKWMDKLLLKVLQPLTRELQLAGITDRWFFTRYQDPDHHIRLRFHLPQYHQHSSMVMQRVEEILHPYLNNDIVRKIQLDTYVRELERYGPALMEHSEAFFFHDSEAVLQLLQTIGGAENKERWLLALKGADELLNSFGYTPMMKMKLLQQLQQQFFSEHHGNAALLLQLNNKYRTHKRLINAVLLDNAHDYTLPDGARKAFIKRAMAWKDIIQDLQTIQQNAITELPPHYLHMFLNRMFTANVRLHELVIYHYLMKYYVSLVARS